MKYNDDEITIDLLALISAVWQKALLIIWVGLLTAAATVGVTYAFISPKYEATASLYVNNSSFSFGSTSFSISSSELSASNSLVNTYIYILNSRTTMEDVIARAQLSYTYEELSEMVTTKAVTGTAAFDVTVESLNPTEAELIANTFAKVLPDRISEIVDGASVRIVDYAIIPAHRASPSYTINAIIGALAGAMLVVGIITIKFIISQQSDNTIYSADMLIELFPDIPVLGMIPDRRVSGKGGYYYSSYYKSDRKAVNR